MAAFEQEGLVLAVDRPFAGALVPSSQYGHNKKVQAVMIEVNRSLYMDEETGERGPDFLDVKAMLERVITTGLFNIAT